MSSLALLALTAVISPAAQQPGLETSAAAFLDAFRAMDESRFDGNFAPDVSMYFPDGRFPQGRVDGRDSVLAAFHAFFSRVRAQGRASLAIEPIDQSVQIYGEIGILTFTLKGEGTLGRRTIVWRRQGERWQIVHFHASTIETG